MTKTSESSFGFFTGLTQPITNALAKFPEMGAKTWKATKGLNTYSRVVITAPVATVAFFGTCFTAPTAALLMTASLWLDSAYMCPIAWLKFNAGAAAAVFCAWLAFVLATSGPLGFVMAIAIVLALFNQFNS